MSESEVVELVLRFAVWLPVETFTKAPWLAPFAVRKVRIREEPNAPGEKRDLWGLPDSEGYFTDDNSLIKSVVLRKSLIPTTNAYGNSRLTAGLVCCHIWPHTTASPLLFSFIPNLVWLPKSLAPYSDGHLARPPHVAHQVLQRVSLYRYFEHETEVASDRVSLAWAQLEAPAAVSVPLIVATELADGAAVVKLVNNRLERMCRFLAATLEFGSAPPPRFSRRYHAGVGKGIDESVDSVQKSLSATLRGARLEEMRSCNRPTRFTEKSV